MELQAFLQSGLLESYVLGQCSPPEVRTVETMLSQHPEARAEKEAIEMALEKYAFAHVAAPPAWMKGRILEQIELQKTTFPTQNLSGKVPVPKIWIAVFGIAGLLGLLISNAYFEIKKQAEGQEQQIAVLQKEATDCAARDSVRRNLQEQVAFLNDPKTKKIELFSTDTSNHAALAIVFDNPEKQKTMLGLTNLPALPAGQDYQLWVIAEGNAAPQPMDVFSPDPTADFAQTVDFHRGAQAFAISIEPKGGSPNGVPTTVVMYRKV